MYRQAGEMWTVVIGNRRGERSSSRIGATRGVAITSSEIDSFSGGRSTLRLKLNPARTVDEVPARSKARVTAGTRTSTVTIANTAVRTFRSVVRITPVFKRRNLQL